MSAERRQAEANQLVVALAEVAVAVVARRREAEARRRSIRLVDPKEGRAA